MEIRSKWVVLCLLAAGLTSTVEAKTTKNVPGNFSGFYGGATLGYNFNKSEFKVSDETGQLGSRNPSLNDFEAGVFGGWGEHFGKYKVYLGLELAYLFLGAKTRFPHVTGAKDNETRKKATIECAVRLGYPLGDILPYAKLGLSNTRVETQTQIPATGGTTKSTTVGDNLTGLLAGGGLDFMYSKRIVMGIGYTYAKFKDKAQQFSKDGTNPPTASSYYELKTKTSSHNLMFRFAYRL